MSILYWSFLLLRLLLKVECVSEKVPTKRLLLTDPNALLSRMEDMDRKMLAMNAQITDLKSQLDSVMKSHHKSGNFLCTALTALMLIQTYRLSISFLV